MSQSSSHLSHAHTAGVLGVLSNHRAPRSEAFVNLRSANQEAASPLGLPIWSLVPAW